RVERLRLANRAVGGGVFGLPPGEVLDLVVLGEAPLDRDELVLDLRELLLVLSAVVVLVVFGFPVLCGLAGRSEFGHEEHLLLPHPLRVVAPHRMPPASI